MSSPEASPKNLDLLTSAPAAPSWSDPAAYWPSLSRALEGVSGPVAAVDVAALRYNALDMLVRSSGVPIRVASKSVRVREIIDATLALPGYHGILAFTLPEALWLAETHDDVVLGYPTVDRAAIAALAADEQAASRITLMVDDLAQLDVVDAVAAPAGASGPARRHRRGCLVASARASATSACTARRCTTPPRSRTSAAPSPRVPDSGSSDS